MICLYSLSLSLYTNVYVVSFGSYFSCDRVVVFFLSIYRRFVAWKFESKREKKLEIQIKSKTIAFLLLLFISVTS